MSLDEVSGEGVLSDTRALAARLMCDVMIHAYTPSVLLFRRLDIRETPVKKCLQRRLDTRARTLHDPRPICDGKGEPKTRREIGEIQSRGTKNTTENYCLKRKTKRTEQDRC
jgi:hypothetical protein